MNRSKKSGAIGDGERSSTETMAMLLTATAGLALIAVLFAGCGGGGGDDAAKVEAGLRDYLATMNPEDTDFPQGAGVVPRVVPNSCKEQHFRPLPREARPLPARKLPSKKFADWTCVLRFGKVAMHAALLVDDTIKVVHAMVAPGLDLPPHTVTLPPARTYTGGSP
jgi:hypothetical protein